ncbi:hypothetical protein [Pseudovibrio axinellae]|uniref:hypothetical protein n=1 Tax=Pseudovibrio axinellae TaxID=989403 RepID=UPI000ACBCA82|nr:hypothetical protein [Pseudovibrio axinellae]
MMILPLQEPDRNPPNPTHQQLEDYYTNYASTSARPYFLAMASIVAAAFTLLYVFTP